MSSEPDRATAPSPHRQTAAVVAVLAIVLVAIVAIAVVSNARRGGLRADILGPRRSEPGEEVEYAVSVRDTAGTVERVDFDFGDGDHAQPVKGLRQRACGEIDEPTTADIRISHTYTRRGVYTARAVVRTGGCGARDEEVEAIRTIEVKKLRR